MDSSTAVYCSTYNESELHNILARWNADSSHAGVLALVAEADKNVIPQLQNLFNRQSTPLIGAFFPELLIKGQLTSNGFTIMRIGSSPNSIIREHISDSEECMDDTVGSIAEICEHNNSADNKNTLVLIIDAMVPKIASLLEKLYLRLGDAVNYMGINCGSESFKPMPCIFDNKQFVQDAVLAFTIPNEQGAILEHGYHMPNKMIAATSTSNNCIVSINWRPAFEVYSEMVFSQYGVKVTKENFYENAVHFPFGIVRADGEVLVRIPVSLQDDGSLFCVGEVPENSVLALLKAEDADSSTTVEHIVKHFAAQAPQTLLTFYCAGRRMHMGDNAASELSALQQKLNSTNIVGALSLGEIGSSTKDGYPLFHNATLVCTAWGS